MNYYEEYFTTESLADNNTITLTIGSNVTTECITYIAYSTDKTNWTSTTPTSSTDTISVTLNNGGKAYWKGSALSLARSYNNSSYWSIFSATGNFKVYGNIASLLYADSFTGKYSLPAGSSSWNYRNFQKLFYLNTKLTSAKGLIFPFNKYENNCCANTFEGCTAMTDTPQMRVVNTGQYALQNMFLNCSSIVDASNIEIQGTITSNGINSMFRGCTSLVKGPIIKNVTLSGSNSLQLFYDGCTSLNYIVNLDPSPDSSRYTNWVKNVSATGTFIKHPDATWSEGASGIPSGWTVNNMNPQTQSIDYSTVTAAYVKGNTSLSAIYARGNIFLWGTPIQPTPSSRYIDPQLSTAFDYSQQITTEYSPTWSTNNLKNYASFQLNFFDISGCSAAELAAFDYTNANWIYIDSTAGSASTISLPYVLNTTSLKNSLYNAIDAVIVNDEYSTSVEDAILDFILLNSRFNRWMNYAHDAVQKTINVYSKSYTTKHDLKASAYGTDPNRITDGDLAWAIYNGGFTNGPECSIIFRNNVSTISSYKYCIVLSWKSICRVLFNIYYLKPKYNL